MKLGPRQKKWINALKSGRYRQGRVALCKIKNKTTLEARFCCLGVACETVYGTEAIPKGEWTIGPNNMVIYDKHSSTSLPDAVTKYLGLHTNEGFPVGNYLYDLEFSKEYGIYPVPLVTLNDHYRWSLEKIGKMLEKFPHVYFKESK